MTYDGREAWRDQANCATTDPELFFIEKGDSHGAARARAICDACPVRQQCLDYALNHNVGDGIWAGLTKSQRKHLKFDLVRR